MMSISDDCLLESEHATTSKLGKLDLASNEMFPALDSVSTYNTAETSIPLKQTWARGLPKPNPTQLGHPEGKSPSNIISHVVQLPFQYQRKHKEFGDKSTLADHCKQVAESTKTLIEASKSAQTHDVTFVLKGTSAGITRARRELWARLAEAVIFNMEVPVECLKFIIGLGGKTLKSIMEETLTKIKIPKSEIYDGYIVVSGDIEGVNLAKSKIEAIIIDKTKKLVSSLSIEKHLLPFIFEAFATATPTTATTTSSFSSIHTMAVEISQKYNVKLSVTLSKEDPSFYLVSASGDRDNVSALIQSISKQYEDKKSSVKMVSTTIPKSLHRFLIGPKASILHHIEEESNCVILLPPIDSQNDQVYIYGQGPNLVRGLSMVLEKTSSMDSRSINLTMSIFTYITHRYRSKIKELEKTCQDEVTIQFKDGTISIDGKKSDVAKVLSKVQDLINPLIENLKFDRIPVDPKYFKHIIGKNGQNLQHFQKEYEVDILILDDSDSDNEQDVLLASTNSTKLKQAHVALLSKISELSELATIEIKVDHKFHKAIIGPHGANVKGYHERYPTLMILFKDEGLVILKGNRKEVEAAQIELKAEVDRIKHDTIMHSYVEELTIRPEEVKDLFFGNRFSKWALVICKDNEIKLNFNPETNILSIQGLKKSVETSKKAIVEQLAKLHDQIVDSFKVNPKYYPVLIGKGGRNLKLLSNKYNVRVVFPENGKDESEAIVTMTGPKVTVPLAKEELLELYNYHIAHDHKEQLVVPALAMPHIIGKDGNTIAELMEQSEVYIKIEHNGEDECKILLEGTVEGISAAKQSIQAIVDEAKSNISIEISITAEQAQKLLHGSALPAYRQLFKSYEGRVFFKDKRDSTAKMEKILLKGHREAVTDCSNQLNSIIAALDQYTKVEMNVPAKHHGEIIGTGGENIRKLCEKFNVTINFSRGSTEPDKIFITGLQLNVEQAKTEILLHVQEKKLVPVSKELKQSILDKYHDEFRQTFNANLTKARDGIFIIGPSLEMDKAVKRLETIATEQIESLDQESIQVPKDQHRYIIGPQGVMIRDLFQSTGCRVIVPDPKDDTDMVVLKGTISNIQLAKARIDEIITGKQRKQPIS